MRRHLVGQRFASYHGRDARDTGRWVIALVLSVILHPSSFILAASLRTLDGKTYQGQITLEPSGQISVTDPRADKPTKVGFKFLEDGRKVRFARASGETIDR